MFKKIFTIILIIISFCLLQSVYAINLEIFIPLDSKSWQGSGLLTFNNGNSSLKWHPKERGSLILTKNIPSNWEDFNCIKFDCYSLTNTGSWIYLIIGTEGNSYLYSYLIIDWIGWRSFTLTFKGLFSSFAKVGSPNLKKVKYLALQSHPDAYLEISKCEVHLNNLRLSYKEELNINKYNIKLPALKNKNLLFSEITIQNIQNLTGKKVNEGLNKVFEELAKNADKIFNVNEETNLSVIRDAALLGRINNDNSLKKLSLINFSKINETHWNNLLKENDILVQEDFINYVLTLDLLRKEIKSDPKIHSNVQKILNYIASKEIEVCRYWISYYPYGYANNHVTRAAIAAGIAALALDDSNIKREETFNLSLFILEKFFNFQISVDGVLNEGTHYYTYLMEILTYFAHFLKNTANLNIFSDFSFSERLKYLVEWTVKIRMPNGFLPCIDDSWQSRVVYPTRFLSEFFQFSSLLNWNSLNVFYPSSINTEPWNIAKSLYIPLYLSTFKENLEVSEPTFEPSLLFTGDSEAVFRENWGKDSAYLFLAGKSLSSLHEHDDTGNIQIYAYNSPILLTSGYGPIGWNSPNRAYYVSAKAHNVVEIDEKGPKGYYNGGTGPIDSSSISNFKSFSKLDFVKINISHKVDFDDITHDRFVYFLKSCNSTPFYTIVLDNVNAGFKRNVTANFHPAGKFLSRKEKSIEYGLKNLNGEELRIKIENLFNCKSDVCDGFYSSYWDEEAKTKYIKYHTQGKNTTIGTVIFPYKASEFIDLQTEGYKSNETIEFKVAIKEKGNDLTDYFSLDKRGNIKQLIYTGSNANISYIRKDNLRGSILTYFIEDGSYLNLNQKGIFFSDKKFNYLYFSKDNILYKYYCEFELNYSSAKTFLNISDFEFILLDGKEIKYEKVKGGVFLTLPAGKHLLTFK